ncbi:MAG: hypothetical protein KDA89_11205 [Planctomycetaceae bacterium]|nr:hypothetical protein [Planctomycetaceae bacterium]
MSATLETADVPEHTDEVSDEQPLPDARVLEDKTPEWCRMSAASSALVFVLGLVLIVFANRPLWHSDLWDHINYGQHILHTHSVAKTEPLLVLADGMPFVNTAWGAQVLMAAAYESPKLGLPSLQFAYAAMITACLAVIAAFVLRKSRSVIFAILSAVILLAVNWQQFLIIRPQLPGLTFFCTLITLLQTGIVRRRWSWFCLPLMFAVWANVHGSFSVGLLVFGLHIVGTSADLLLRTRSVRCSLLNRSVVRQILLLQLCASAVLLNPNGLALYDAVLRVGSHPNIASMYEWDPLTLRMKQGQAFAVAAIILLLVLRLSPRRLKSTELLPLVVTGLLALWSSRMINWFAPVAAMTIGCHGAAAWRCLRKQIRPLLPTQRTGLWTVVNLGLCWIFFGLTSFGLQTVHGKPTDPARLVSAETPRNLLSYFHESKPLPAGVAFVPAEWAGFLMQFGPTELRPMVNLHVHVIPEEVWNDYLRLISGPSDWNGLLDRYGIDLVITDKLKQPRLTKLIADSADFAKDFEDAQSVVFRRRTNHPDETSTHGLHP